ncbi:MAG: hypothetical protein AB7O62_22150 [Pirellulales bacterium]
MQPLTGWMKATLYFVAAYNVLAGLSMLVNSADSYRMIGISPPDSDYLLHLCGLVIALFGVGYFWVVRRPLENQGVLALGMASKLAGSALGVAYVAAGRLPPRFLAMAIVSDLIYVPLFWLILRRLRRVSQCQGTVAGDP